MISICCLTDSSCMACKTVFMKSPLMSISSASLMDQVKDTKNTDFQWLENIAIQQALDKLTPREQHIIDMRFFQGKTQMEVADEIAISQAQVSRLEKGALQSMRKYV